MMEKAIKQRLLGGLVLVAGAALFLPVLLDGSGAALTIPPMPRAPEVGGVEALAPRLDRKVAEAEQAIDAAHAGREEAATDVAPAAGEGADVAPDAAALTAVDGRPPEATAASRSAMTPAAATATAPPPAVAATRPAVAPVAPAKAPAAVAAAPQSAIVGTAPAKPAAIPTPAKPAAASPAPAAAKTATPAVAAAKPAEPRDATRPAADQALPGAWLVQVGVFSSRDKAQALVQQLRHKGYAAVLHPQGDSFKVVVGPELNRSVADSIKTRLATDPELKLNGWVQAYKP